MNVENKYIFCLKMYASLVTVIALGVSILFVRSVGESMILRLELGTRIVMAADCLAKEDHEAGRLGFYELSPTERGTSLGNRDGIPVKAWLSANDGDGCNRRFVLEYNDRMSFLIKQGSK